jgi:two-component system, NtrC family, nitrogen regulation response regulator NtrX
MTLTILVVDDVPALADQYAYDLRRLGGGSYDTIVANSGKAALEVMEQEPVDCAILDLEMPAMDGFEVLRELGRRGWRVPVIVYTGTGDFDRCTQAVRLGAQGFIDKAEPMERVMQEIENAIERRRLADRVAELKREAGHESPLVGSSASMSRLREQIAKIAPIPSAVLIVGESGSGKELVAREIQRLSGRPRSSGPFVAINSAALPENLVEDELFGHERGAFTGANALRKGAFETASGGTLFLDEIGDLPLPAQAKLLRVLEERQVTRLGGHRTVAVDTRVVAATNRELEDEVKAGRFREDLYYRLNVHLIRVPPLRERLSDVPALVEHLLAFTCARFGMRGKKVLPEAMDALTRYSWRRNNVRELRNVVERMIIAADDEVVTLDDIPSEVRDGALLAEHTTHHAPRTDSGEPRTFHELKVDSERRIVLEALDRNDWHITKTAKALGLADHASLLKIMRRHGIKGR